MREQAVRSDQMLFQLLASSSGSAEAVSLLYQKYGADVRRFVLSRIAPVNDVEDVCGEIWLAVSTAINRFRGDAAPRTWILEIARHKIADVGRRGANHRTVPIDRVISQLAASTSMQPGMALERTQLNRAVRRVISNLTIDEQELLVLRYERGLTPAQIILEKKLADRPNTVSKRLSLLRRRIRRLIEDESLGAARRQ